MSFVWFRKYHKPFLWFSVVFTILVFATFSGLGDFKRMVQRSGTSGVLGEFKVSATGNVRQVESAEFMQLRTAMNRMAYVTQRGEKVSDDEVWAQLMKLADAKGAGLDVSTADLVKMFPPSWTKDDYARFWRDQLQFPSAHDFEDFMHDQMLAAQWENLATQAAGVVDADEVYLRWRTDNEVFDVDAVVIPDVPLDKITDPTADEVKTYWDGQPEPQRNARFVEPQREDIVYGWWPLDGSDGVPDEKLAALPEPSADEIKGRFDQTRATRWPDKTEVDDAIKAVLVRELRLVSLAQQAADAFEARQDKSAATFTETMTAAGLRVVDPQGELGTEELKKVEGIGDELLPLWLGQRKAGELHFGYPYAGQKHVEVVYLETMTPSRPLTFEEAHDQIVKAWKEARRDTPARDFRELLRKRTRDLPEVQAIIQPLLDAAQKRADEEVAAKTDLDEAGKAALRKQLLDDAEQQDILPRVAEYEHLVWADAPLPEGARRVEVRDVPRAYARKLDGGEASDSIERFLKTNGAIFRLAVDAISEPLRHGPTSQTVIALVAGRSFPDKAAMLADVTGMDIARKQVQNQRLTEARQAFTPERLKVSHDLKILKPGVVN